MGAYFIVTSNIPAEANVLGKDITPGMVLSLGDTFYICHDDSAVLLNLVTGSYDYNAEEETYELYPSTVVLQFEGIYYD